MKNVYLLLAILGAIVPYGFFIAHFQAEGLALDTFIRALFVNGAAGGFTADLLISSAAFWVWLFASRAKKPWLFVGLNFFIGLSCAFPAYLYARARDAD
ncbi:MAG: DUF2834 domain-containing protein [Gemmatimonadota bacterium]